MTNPDPLDEREARRQFVRRRQKMVFTIALVSLAVILVVCLLTIFGSVGAKARDSAASKPNYGVRVPCAPENAKVASHQDIRVRVMNGTSKSGLATAVSSAMKIRGFNTQGAGDYPGKSEVTRTQIRFGASGIAKGYTVAGQFTDAVMIMDDRNDDLVDIIIGATFNDLTKDDKASQEGKPITSIDGCIKDVNGMKAKLPKAPAR